MGFGFLGIGYFLTTVLSYNPMGYAFMLIGTYVMLMGLIRLSGYSIPFRFAFYADIGLLVVALCKTVAGIYLLIDPGSSFFISFGEIVSYVNVGLMIVFHVFLIYGVFEISKRLEVEQGKTGAVRNMILGILYYGLYVFSLLPFSFRESFIKVMGLPILLLMFALYLSCAWMIFSCYYRIVPDVPDTEEPKKSSRFAFVNKLRAIKEEHDRRASESAQAYYVDKMKKRIEKNNQKQNKKK